MPGFEFRFVLDYPFRQFAASRDGFVVWSGRRIGPVRAPAKAELLSVRFLSR